MTPANYDGIPAGEHSLDVPPFLMVTAEEHERRMAWNKTHPVTVPVFMSTAPAGTPTVTAEEIQKRADELRERERQASYARLQAMNDKKMAARKDMRWDNGRWVRADGMTRRKFIALLEEMPTDEHRAILRAKYENDFPGVPERLKGDAAQDSLSKGDTPGVRTHATPTRHARAGTPQGVAVGRAEKKRATGSNPVTGAKAKRRTSRGRKTTY